MRSVIIRIQGLIVAEGRLDFELGSGKRAKNGRDNCTNSVDQLT